MSKLKYKYLNSTGYGNVKTSSYDSFAEFFERMTIYSDELYWWIGSQLFICNLPNTTYIVVYWEEE